MGVAVTDALFAKRYLLLEGLLNSPAGSTGSNRGAGSYTLSPAGARWFAALGIETKPLQLLRRAFARPCLDWSERRHHLAGSLGAALLDKMLSEDWLRRVRHSRTLIITAKGEKKLDQLLEVSL